VQDTAGQVAGQAQETATKVIDQVKETATSRLEDQKNRAAQGVASVAQAMHEAGRSLEEDSPVADYAERAAFYLDKFSDYLQQRDLRGLITEVEHFARRQPTLFIGGGLLLGMLGARFLKSSGSEAQAAAQNRTSSNTEMSGGANYGRTTPENYGRSGMETFTTQGNYTTEGIRFTGSEDTYNNGGEQTIHSYYRVGTSDTDNSEV